MPGYSRIIFNDNFIWIRFERIGSSGRFDILLDDFRSTFPLAVWDARRRAWQLSAEQLKSVTRYCEKKLGRGRVKLYADDITRSKTEQLSFI